MSSPAGALLPESLNAIRAAACNAVRTSLNGALGSVLATIGLTAPAVAAPSLRNDRDIAFGLEPRAVAMLSITLLLSLSAPARAAPMF
ncbi:MAG: hypothetical protein N2444_05085 [Methylocystis sp.]|nr:hypothetical protein [Methylocystis sp.]